MSKSKLPESKFAILYTGIEGNSNDAKYLSNIEQVYKTLRFYYGIPEENLWVILGADPGVHTLDVPLSCLQILSVPADFTTNMQAILNDPMNGLPDYLIDGNGELNTVYLYFTGKSLQADSAAPGPFANYRRLLVSGTEALAAMDLVGLIQSYGSLPDSSGTLEYTDLYDTHLIFDTNDAGGFQYLESNDALENFSLTTSVEDGGNTSDNVNTSPDGFSGGFLFTELWCKALQLQPLVSVVDDPANPGSWIAQCQYAYELSPTGEINTDPEYDRLITVRKVFEFVKQQFPVADPQPQYWQDSSDKAFFPGSFALTIHDGDPQRWESPDIWLYHPNHIDCNEDIYLDHYITDDPAQPDEYNNEIVVRVWNTGTHPLHRFNAGVVLYHSGAGGSGEERFAGLDLFETEVDQSTQAVSVLNDEVLVPYFDYDPLDPFDIPANPDTDPRTLDYVEMVFDDVHFSTSNHRCIRARADYEEVDHDSIVNLNPYAEDGEAQRNIDYTEICFKSAETPGDTGDAGDEQEKEEAEGTFEIHIPKHLKAHMIRIPLPMDQLPPNLLLDVDLRGVKNKKEVKLIKQIRGHRQILEAPVEAGAKVEFRYRMKFTKPGFPEEEIRLPFEFLIKANFPKMKGMRADNGLIPFAGYKAVGGMTKVLRPAITEVSFTSWIPEQRKQPIFLLLNGHKDGFAYRIPLQNKQSSYHENINPGQYHWEILSGKQKKKGGSLHIHNGRIHDFRISFHKKEVQMKERQAYMR